MAHKALWPRKPTPKIHEKSIENLYGVSSFSKFCQKIVNFFNFFKGRDALLWHNVEQYAVYNILLTP